VATGAVLKFEEDPNKRAQVWVQFGSTEPRLVGHSGLLYKAENIYKVRTNNGDRYAINNFTPFEQKADTLPNSEEYRTTQHKAIVNQGMLSTLLESVDLVKTAETKDTKNHQKGLSGGLPLVFSQAIDALKEALAINSSKYLVTSSKEGEYRLTPLIVE
jgi:hypothetical protein